MAARTAAAPDMSVFMVAMPAAVLIDRPPESNVIPLPTKATVGVSAVAPGGSYSNSTSRGGSTDPRATPIRPPRWPADAAWCVDDRDGEAGPAALGLRHRRQAAGGEAAGRFVD